MIRLVRLLAASSFAAALALSGPATPAHALALEVQITVDPIYLSATAKVADPHFRGTFTGSLTSNGYAICGPTSPQTVLTAADERTGNPLLLSVPGTCAAYHATVTYNLQWTSIGGTSGHHAVHCLVIFGAPTCSIPGYTLQPPDSVQVGPFTIRFVLPEVS